MPLACFSTARGFSTFWHSEYFRSAERHADVTCDKNSRALLNLYDSLYADPELHLSLWLEPGHLLFISNHTTAHARTTYEDTPDRRRHL